jgi:hypothetical protein
MSWIWTPITIADGVEKDDPTKVDITAAVGRIRGFAVAMPLTTAGQDAGIRVLAADRRLFPGMAEGADQWLHVQKFAFNQVYEDAIMLQEVAPVLISVQGYNKSGGSIAAQVGVRLEPSAVVTEQFTATIASALVALVEVTQWPDLERQLRRLWTFVNQFKGGNDNER